MTDPLAHILATAPDLDDPTDAPNDSAGADRGYGKRSAYRSGHHPKSRRKAAAAHPWRNVTKTGGPPAADTEPGRLVLTAADLEARKAAEAAPTVDYLAAMARPLKPPGR